MGGMAISYFLHWCLYIALGPLLIQSLLCIDLMCSFLESECVPSCIWFFAILWTLAHQSPLSMGLFRQEYWSELPFPSPGDLLDPGIELASRESPALADKFFTTDSLPGATWEAPGKWVYSLNQIFKGGTVSREGVNLLEWRDLTNMT